MQKPVLPKNPQQSPKRELLNDIEALFSDYLSAHDKDATCTETYGNRDALTERILDLLQKKPQKLMQLLYRIDVSEQKVKDLFNGQPDNAIANSITELILERMVQKMAFKKHYAQQ